MNTMGYYAIFLGLQYKHSVAMTSAFDANQYNATDAVTIKIPMILPYMNEDSDFRRVDGAFEYKGEFYRLIKQKYANEMLTVICIKDTEKKRINEAITDYVMTFGDTGDDQGSQLTISFIKDYIPQTLTIITTSNGWQSDVVESIAVNCLVPTFTSSVIHPPERA